MNLPTLVVVLLRLASLNFLLQVIVQLVFKLTSVINASEHLPAEEFRSALVMPLLVVLGLTTGTVLLWVWAMPLARFITRGLAPELSLETLSLADCYALVFIGLGLFYAVDYFAPVLNWIHYLLRMAASHSDNDWKQRMHWYEVSRAFITFIVAIVLIVNGRKWAVALAKRGTLNGGDSATVTAEQTDI
jgi:hypothetical protein